MRKVLTWLLDRWYLPLAVIGAVIGAFIFRKWGDTPIALVVAERVQAEMKLIDAGAEVRRVKAELGAEQAKQHVADKYRAEMDALDVKQKLEARWLEDSPVALAKFLVRASSQKKA